MEIDSEFSDLVGSIYQGAMEEPPWQEFLSRVREVLGAHLVTLLLRPPGEVEQAVMLSDGGSLSAIKSYNEGQFVLDPFIDLPSRQVIGLHEYLSSETLLNSEFYRVIMEPQGWYDFIGADIRDGGELDVRFRVGRHKGAALFSAREKQLIEALLPHIERSICLQGKISRTERERAVYAGAVEQLSVSTIILDELGQVVSTNESADALLGMDNSIYLHEGRIEFGDSAAAGEFARLLDTVMTGRRNEDAVSAEAMQVRRPEGLPDLGLVVRVLRVGTAVTGRHVPTVAIFVSNPEQASEPPREVIRRLFGFTPTEANLAMLLANGLTLDEASGELGVSRNTARTHLRAVFSKTGVTRQTGLVRLILNSVAPLAGHKYL